MNDKPYRTHLMLCSGLSCASSKSFEVREALESELHKCNLKDEVLIVVTGCNGLCPHGPIMIVQPDNILYHSLTAEDIPHLVEEHFLKGRPVKDLIYAATPEELPIPKISDVGFFNKQRLVVFRNRGQIDPENIEEYIARGGYKALAKVLTSMTPEEVLQEIQKSGLRGRGGAGFPTGLKWELCRKAKGEPKYIVCNADEGDPGAYMDRAILEGDPHGVLEGMLIGAYAIGATQGYIYIRSEYPLAVVKKQCALDRAREYGLVGKDIFGTGFDFDIKIMQGSGAFVCGEETSLIASIEGKNPEPRMKPPFPVESGLWGKPTNINNVETWANVPVIIHRGAKWFSEIGTEKSKGTKIFSLVGKINNTGLVEVPMGTTLREIIYDIGGGIPDGKGLKSVQTGGPSGGCIPAKLIDLPIDYERLAEVGSIMGSGGMIIMDEDTCMVDIAKYFIQFTSEESCGKCSSCREGSQALLDILTRITNGEGKDSDIELLRELSEGIKDASLCGLGQTLPNPVLSTLNYFMEEYEQHIKYKRCPAAACKGIISSACQHICPLGQDVPCYVGLIVQGKFKEAVEIIKKENPLPLICGRVCHHPCEDKCRAGDGGAPIAIRSLKRFLADYELEHGISIEKKPKQARDERVAVIGSGPAGLACAYYLALEGYQVTVFERLPIPGGMLAVGIPEYRLPKEILKFEIESIKKLGVEIKTNIGIGKDVQILDLKKEYKAVFIATGAHKGLKLRIDGEDMKGVIDAVEFLRKVNLGEEVNIGKKVVVIGGGNAAIDAARVAKRFGKNVQIIYRRTKIEMPAEENEIEEAVAEGIDIEFLAAPVKVLSSNGKVEAVECVRMKLGDVDKSGRRRPVPVEQSEFTVKLDTLIPAIGQEPDITFLTNGSNVKISKWNTIEVNPETLYTNEEGIFAGGDVVTGPNTVTDAMAQGKVAAQMIHKYIQGEPLEREYKVTRPAIQVEATELTDEEIEQLTEVPMPTMAIDERTNFKEVELGFGREQAINEAKRCLRCDLERELKE